MKFAARYTSSANQSGDETFKKIWLDQHLRDWGRMVATNTFFFVIALPALEWVNVKIATYPPLVVSVLTVLFTILEIGTAYNLANAINEYIVTFAVIETERTFGSAREKIAYHNTLRGRVAHFLEKIEKKS